MEYCKFPKTTSYANALAKATVANRTEIDSARDSFQRFTEFVVAQSGGMFGATPFAGPCKVSRPTITNYLRVREATFVEHVIRPFSTHGPTEIFAAAKVYGVDTGFICYY